ncbi:MAG: hypothetical protein E7262_05205 [Lachnospiraceae bacterium]|nr:hypothetical protein [Lachnospiraceae bacterium]
MKRRFGKIKDDIFNGKLFENKKSIRNMSNRKFSKNIIMGNDVYIDMYAGLETYKKSNFLYGNMTDIRECFLEPNILQMNMSYIVKDYDGVLYETYREIFENAGYNVKVVNFIDYLESDKFNVFSFFNYEQDVSMFVDLVTKSYTLDISNSERLVKSAEKYLLEAILYYIMIELPHEEHNMKTVFRMLKLAKPYDGVESEYASDLDLLFNDIDDNEEHMALYKYNKFKTSAARIERMVIENIEQYLALYNVNSIRTICNENEIQIEEMIDSYEILFVVTPLQAKEYERISDIFMYQSIMYLDYLAEKKYHGKLPAPIHIMAPGMISPLMDIAVENCYKRNMLLTLGTDRLAAYSNIYSNVYDLIEKCSVFICYDYNNLEIKEYVKSLVIEKYNSDIHTEEKVSVNANIEIEDYMEMEDADCVVCIQYVKAICAEVFEPSRLSSFEEVTSKEMKAYMESVEQALAGQIYSNLIGEISKNVGAIKIGDGVNIDIGAKKLITDRVYENITMKVKKNLF